MIIVPEKIILRFIYHSTWWTDGLHWRKFRLLLAKYEWAVQEQINHLRRNRREWCGGETDLWVGHQVHTPLLRYYNDCCTSSVILAADKTIVNLVTRKPPIDKKVFSFHFFFRSISLSLYDNTIAIKRNCSLLRSAGCVNTWFVTLQSLTYFTIFFHPKSDV